jgi:hypothetical protein
MKRTGGPPRKSKTKARTADHKAKHRLLGRWEQGPFFAAAILIAVVFACYANSLGNGFVFDDEFLVPAFGRAWTFSQFVNKLLDSYRPVRNASYAIDFLIWGSRPFGFHLTNLIIHAANAVLVFFLISRFRVKRSVAFLAALIFAVRFSLLRLREARHSFYAVLPRRIPCLSQLSRQ